MNNTDLKIQTINILHQRINLSVCVKGSLVWNLCYVYRFSFVYKIELIKLTNISLVDLLWKTHSLFS